MHIGELAERVGTTTRTVRYYEEMGLIKPARRTSGGFRCYAEEQVDRLQMILSLKDMGFDLESIKTILDKRGLHGTGGHLAADVLRDMKERLCKVNAEIEALSQMRERLVSAVDALCQCLPCEVRLEERLCANCEKLRNGDRELPFFHAIQPN